MAFLGVDPGELRSSIKGVGNAYTSLFDHVNTGSRSYMENLQKIWANGNGVDFGEAFKETMNNILNQATDVFQNVNSAMNSAGRAWNESNKSSSFSDVSFSSLAASVASAMQSNLNGAEGMDPDEVAAATQRFCNDFKKQVESDLESAKSAVSGARQFLGGSQKENLLSSLDEIKNSMNKAVEQIASEVSKATGKNIEVTTQTAQDVASAMAGR